MKKQILYFFLFFTTISFSQTVEKKAKCVNDFILYSDTLTFFCVQPTSDSTFYMKFQVFKTNIGLIAKEFHSVRIKKSSVTPKNIRFKESCTSNVGSYLDFKSLSEFELKVRNPIEKKFGCGEKVNFYIYSKNKNYSNIKRKCCIYMLHNLEDILSCITLDQEVRSGR